MKTMRNLKGNKGFSLIELMVVVAIMGALAAIALPMYNKYRAKTLQERALNEGRSFMQAFRAAYAASETRFRISGVMNAAGTNEQYFRTDIATKTPYPVRTYKNSNFDADCTWTVNPFINNGEPSFTVTPANVNANCIDLVTGANAAAAANVALRDMLFKGKIGSN